MGRLKAVSFIAMACLGAGLVAEHGARRRDAAIEVGGRELKVNGRSMQVYESGPWPSPEAVVVLLPGAGDTAESWSVIRGMLSGSRRVLSYDRPGMGHSEPRPSPGPGLGRRRTACRIVGRRDWHPHRARGPLLRWPHRSGVQGLPSRTGRRFSSHRHHAPIHCRRSGRTCRLLDLRRTREGPQAPSTVWPHPNTSSCGSHAALPRARHIPPIGHT